MYLLKLRKKPTSIESSNDNTLRLSNLINAVFYYLLFYLMKTADIIPIYYLYILSLVLVNVFVFAISLNYNISLYMVYAGSLVGYIAGLCLFFHYRLIYVLIGIVIFSGFAASSRLILGKHKPSEVYSGFLLGVGLLLLVLVLIPR